MNNKSLKDKILEANEAYRKGMPIMTDDVYDALLEDLEKALPANEYSAFRDSLNEGILVTSEKKKIKHDYVAGSLDKLKYEEPAEIKKFLKTNVKTALHISAKIDGLSGILKYVDGKLVSLGTRGDGTVGEDQTEKAKFIKYIPTEIPIKETVSVRGELVILKDDLMNFDGTAARNIVSGLIGRKEWNSSDISNVSFVAYTILGDKYTKEEQFKILAECKFKTAWNVILQKQEIDSIETDSGSNGIVDTLFDFATQDFEYETDGLVLSDVSYRNEDKYRPDCQRAFKTNQQGFETKIIDIEWSGPSKDGIFCPIAILEPVDVGGVTVSRCTLHNLDFIEKKGVKIGDRISIVRSGDVIPKILKVVETDKNSVCIDAIDTCTSCGSKLIRDGVNMRCLNKMCEAQTTYQVALFIRKFDVESANVKTLNRFGIHTIQDLLKFKPNIKYKTEVKLANEIASKIFTASKRDLLAAMNFHGIGTTIVNKIIDEFSYDAIENDVNVVTTRRIVGVGDSFIQRFLDDVCDNIKLVNLIASDVRYSYVEKPTTVVSNNMPFAGSVCFTGALSIPRSQAAKLAENAGFEVKGGVSKGLTYLVTNTPNSNSSKNKKAQQLRTKVITEEEFMKIINSNTVESDVLAI